MNPEEESAQRTDSAANEHTATLAQRIKKLWLGLRRSLRRLGEAPQAEEQVAPQFIEELGEGLLGGEMQQHDQLREKILLRARSYWQTGYDDGANGLKRARISAVVTSAASLMQQEAISHHAAKTEQFTKEIEAKNEILEATRKRLQRRHEYLEELEEKRRENPRAMSVPLALAYGLIGVLLIFADLPLALKLTQVGFDLSYSLTPEGGLGNLLRSPLLVITENWEVFVLAMGFCLCTIYIKIFYDRVSDQAPNRFSGAILGLTIFTIVVLGVFRYVASQMLPSQPQTASYLRVLLQSDEVQILVACVTFILITLLFPLVGAICASLSLSQIHSRSALWRATREARHGTMEYESASADLAKHLAEKSQWDGMLEWISKAGFDTAITQLLQGAYDHGYERGWTKVMQQIRDPLAAAEVLRRNAWTRGISNWINGEATNGGRPA